MNLSKGFQLTAILDGETLNGYLRLEGAPLVQRYTQGTETPVPDFTALAEDQRPTLVVVVKTSTGEWTPIQAETAVWRYNGIILTFDSAGLSTNTGYVGVFKRIMGYQLKDGSHTYSSIALRVMKNLYSLGNKDNDRISFSGSCEIGGQQISVEDLSREIVIEETTGQQWSIYLNNMDINEKGQTVTLTPEVYRSSQKLTNYEGLAFKWYKLTADGYSPAGTSTSLTIQDTEVNGSLLLRCDLISGESVVASATATIEDYSDPLAVRMEYSGITARCVRKGQTATLTPVAYHRSDGSIDPSYNSWVFRLQNNAGEPFELDGKGSEFTAASFSITFEQMKKAGFGLSGNAVSVKK